MVNKDPRAAERSIDRVLKRLKDLDWNQSEFAKKMGVLAQDVTNWKSRGMPTDKLEEAADVLTCSVDWLLGRHGATPPWPFDVLFDDYENLDGESKVQIQEFIEDRIGRFKKGNGPAKRRKSLED